MPFTLLIYGSRLSEVFTTASGIEKSYSKFSSEVISVKLKLCFELETISSERNSDIIAYISFSLLYNSLNTANEARHLLYSNVLFIGSF